MGLGNRVTLEDVRRLTLFCEVEDRDLAMIAHGLERESFAGGDFIFGQGEPADSAIFIADGEQPWNGETPRSSAVALCSCPRCRPPRGGSGKRRCSVERRASCH